MKNIKQHDEPNKATLNQAEAVAKIAKELLGLDTIETRNSDEIDFSEQSVWQLRAALEAAYNAGLVASLQKK